MRVARLSLAAAMLAVAALASLPAPVALAQGGLELVADTRYDLLPASGRIRVTIEFTATNTTPETEEGRTVVTGVTLGIHPGAVAIIAQSDGQTLPSQVIEATEEFTRVDIEFSREVVFEETYRFGLTYELTDPGGPAARDLRIGRTLIAFPVWAFGSEDVGAGLVSVLVPAGYTPTVEVGELQVEQLANGAWLLSAPVGDPLSFFAYVAAERPGAFAETLVDAAVCPDDPCVVVRAWDDDPRWGADMADLISSALPVLEELIGLEYPIAGRLTVEEAATARLGAYAGLFDTFADTIRIRYDADHFVALHELSHAWFNARLYTDRWIDEAFASYYADRAAERLALEAEAFRLTDDLLAARIPLNLWGQVGREDVAVEDYAYAASYELGVLIAARGGEELLADVWRASEAGELAYQPIHPASGAEPDVTTAEIQEGWQRLLDLLEERGDAEFTDLWVDWVLHEGQLPQLEDRERARAAYRAAVTRARDWELPRTIRLHMSSWSFATAEPLMREASTLLGERNSIETMASVLGLEPTDELRTLFQAGDLDQAAVVADEEMGALETIRRAGYRLAEAETAVEVIGLLGIDPAMSLQAARDLYEHGDAPEATERAAEAIRQREAATRSGTDRVVLGAASLLAADGLLLAALGIRRRRGLRAGAETIA